MNLTPLQIANVALSQAIDLHPTCSQHLDGNRGRVYAQVIGRPNKSIVYQIRYDEGRAIRRDLPTETELEITLPNNDTFVDEENL